MFTVAKRSPKWKINNLTKQLRNEIISGKLASGIAMPPSEELAKKIGSSAITINRIMAKLADEGLVTRIKGRGTFVKMQNQAPKKQLKIGIADNPSPQNTDIKKIMGVLAHYCMDLLSDHNAAVKIIPYLELKSLDKASKQLNDLDGVLFSNTFLDPVTYANVSHFNIPVVMYQNDYIVDCSFNQVVPDMSESMSEVFKYIAPGDYEEIVVVSARHANAYSRRDSFINAAIAAGFDRSKIISIESSSQSKEDGGYRIGCQLAKKKRKMFIYSTSDFVSFGIVDAMRDCGIEPGMEIQLLSCDNLEGYGFSHFSQPLLTSIDTSRQMVARKCVELLLHKISNPDTCQYIIKVPTQLKIRDTALKSNHSIDRISEEEEFSGKSNSNKIITNTYNAGKDEDVSKKS
ncbi:MAG: GntR family transcriptional regulator [Lentisphaerota bacterium]